MVPEPSDVSGDGKAARLLVARTSLRGSLRLRSGPERIETRWWTGQEVCRDYYVADNARGMRLWIFHEREGERRWFLHGIFD